MRNTRKPIAICISDVHIDDASPECRTDDYQHAMLLKFDYIRALQEKYKCPIFDGGDVFSHWSVSSEMESIALQHMPNNIITVPGNHDLKNHNINFYKKSSLHVLETAGKVIVLKEASFQLDNLIIDGFPYRSELISRGGNVAIAHVYVGHTIPQGVDGYHPQQLIDKLTGYDLIVTGHNHESFIYKGKHTLLINPGSIMRRAANEEHRKPCIYLWYGGESVSTIELPIQQNVIKRDHVDMKNRDKARLEALVTKTKTLAEDNHHDSTVIADLFRKKMQEHFAKHKPSRAVKDTILEAMEK